MSIQIIVEIMIVYGVFMLVLGMFFAGVMLADHLGARPFRWLSQARHFVNALDMAKKRGIPYEEALIKLADYGERDLGIYFHVLAEWLRTGMKLHEALPLVPKCLPRPMHALVIFGSRHGLLDKLIPVAQNSLQELTGRTDNQRNEIFGLLTIAVGVFGIVGMTAIFVLPKLEAIIADMVPETQIMFLTHVLEYRNWFLFFHAFVIAFMSIAFFFMVGGTANHSYIDNRLPGLSDLAHRFFPWQRQRQEQRFGRMLATLLDEKVPEEVALKVAGAFAANRGFRERIDACVTDLQGGKSLINALSHIGMDGDFKFRMQAAKESQRPFAETLKEWFEALHVRAQMRERAITDAASTAFTVYNAVIVGLVTYGFFEFEVTLINQLAAW
ncbi:MAG: type II secretion system F family protein [Limisphaerales bacterium]